MRIIISVALTIGTCLAAMFVNTPASAEGPSQSRSVVVELAENSSRIADEASEQTGQVVSAARKSINSEPKGGPYIHVAPKDAGVTIGAGVIAPYPSEAYTGPLTIKSPVTIENVLIDGCLRIESDDVTLRNVVITCNSYYPVKATHHANALIEYSLVICTKPTKVFRLISYQNFAVQHSETRGCEDLFFLSGNNDGLDVSYNYMHSLTLIPTSHADGFQFGLVPTSGSGIIRGNYFWANAKGKKTDTIYAEGKSQVQLLIEDNFFRIWGLRTIRCGGEGSSCIIRNNIYEQAFEDMNVLPYGKLLFSYLYGKGAHEASCNRLEDGSLIKEFEGRIDRFHGVSHSVDNCPQWPY
ncbi:hypothetical protein [Microbulbifer pacificus]|uniref:Right handed beta helix region n=1 Tax=Microbulbifer pacificus TaxID=407164 RepID=A0AAU0MZ07_9GAMM|nr:hypothetical protein [Microbulbifer pacificus]WOX05248.1 hypothetical protein R5R33_16105 [Microbulbifer pacificus]